MHEYSVVAELVEALLPRLEEHAGEVTAVFLKKGDLRILSDRALKSAFVIVTQGTRLEGAALEIESIKVRVACRSCSYEGPATTLEDDGFHFAVPILACPECESRVEIRAGRELSVERVSLRTAVDASAYLPEIVIGGVSCAKSMLIVFFGLPSPSLSMSQLRPSVRPSVWQVAQVSQCWKQSLASWK